MSRTFFKFFFEESSRSKSNFSVLRLSLRDSFNRIPNPRAFVKYFFRFLQKILLQTKNDGSRRRFLFLPMFGQNQTAELEREYILRRQHEGIAIAKEQGKYTGRKPRPLPDNFERVVARWRAGEITAVEAMRQTGLKPNTPKM